MSRLETWSQSKTLAWLQVHVAETLELRALERADGVQVILHAFTCTRCACVRPEISKREIRTREDLHFETRVPKMNLVERARFEPASRQSVDNPRASAQRVTIVKILETKILT